jgi:hypothetical protein
MGAKLMGDRGGFEGEYGESRTVRSLDTKTKEERNA